MAAAQAKSSAPGPKPASDRFSSQRSPRDSEPQLWGHRLVTSRRWAAIDVLGEARLDGVGVRAPYAMCEPIVAIMIKLCEPNLNRPGDELLSVEVAARRLDREPSAVWLLGPWDGLASRPRLRRVARSEPGRRAGRLRRADGRLVLFDGDPLPGRSGLSGRSILRHDVGCAVGGDFGGHLKMEQEKLVFAGDAESFQMVAEAVEVGDVPAEIVGNSVGASSP